MFRDRWEVDYQGHKIEVLNYWGSVNIFSLSDFMGKIILRINDKEVDSLNSFVAFGNKPSLLGDIYLDNGIKKRVEVYMQSGLFSVKVKICIDGKKIGGDDF